MTADRRQSDLRGGARLEALRGARRNGQTHPICGGAIERQTGIHLEEVEVGSDADRHVGGVGGHEVNQLRRLHGLMRRGQDGARCVVAQTPGAAERVAYHHHARAVIEHCFDAHLAHDVGDTGQDLVGTQHLRPGCSGLHDPRPVARCFADGVGDQRRRLGNVQPQAAPTARPRQLRSGEDQQPVSIGRSETHEANANVTLIKRSALGNGVLVRFTTAFLFATLSQWALFVAALVYAFDRGGSRAAGLASIALLVPIVLVAPRAAMAAHTHHPNSVRLISYTLQAAGLTLASVAAAADGPSPLVVGGCAVASGAFTLLGPAGAVVLPSIVRSARELVVANVWLGGCESVSTLAGSGLAAVMLAVQGPALALAVCAALTAAATVLTLLDRSAAHGIVMSAAPRGAVRWVTSSIAGLRERPGVSGVLAIAGGQYVLVGSLDLVLVVLAEKSLHMGTSGPGVLTTSVGAGAVVCAVTSTFLVRRARLAPLLIGALAAVAVAAVAVGIAPTLTLALVVLPLIGFSRALLDLTSRMLLQRATPPHSLAAIVGAIELFAGVGMLVGSVVSQLLIAAAGVKAALIELGAFFAVLLVLTMRSLRRADDSADIPVVAISLLRRIPAFAPLPPLELETVARAAVEVPVEMGDVVMAEGDPADSYYAVADGVFDVTIGGDYVRTAERGGGFGEIALLANVPRTATITARRPGALLAIHRDPFLTAVTGSDASRRAVVGMARAVGVDLDIALDD